MAKISSISSITESIRRRLFRWEDELFEKRHDLELSPVYPTDLVTDNADSSVHANACQAVWCRNLREIFTQAGKADVVLKNFVDIGSGKGKACLFAAQRMPFEKILGIELSKPLVAISNENARRFGRADIEFHHADARDFSLPEACNLVFLFNPFDEVILQKFIENNLRHFQQQRSILAYANDIHRDVISSAGFTLLFRNPVRCVSLYQWPVWKNKAQNPIKETGVVRTNT